MRQPYDGYSLQGRTPNAARERVAEMKPAQGMVLCPEYEGLREAYFDAARECQAATSVYTAGLRRHAVIIRDSARERALAHKRECSVCANIKVTGSAG